jgi:hypothetical protein
MKLKAKLSILVITIMVLAVSGISVLLLNQSSKIAVGLNKDGLS